MFRAWSEARRERIRYIRGRRFWDECWRGALEFPDFQAYLATIPPIPERPAACPAHLNRIVLWDVRPFIENGVVSLARACTLLGMPAFQEIDQYVNHASLDELGTSVQWIWCQDGQRYREQNPAEC